MKAVMLMFDTLTRNFLPNYGCDFTIMPNFQRLASKACTFDEFYSGSMPCMPARRELHTGKYNFLHRSWGPLEPFDVSVMEKLREAGVYTHLCTDHSHYWEDGGATYHTRYRSYELFRGQEGDRWTPQWNADFNLNTCKLNKTNESAAEHLANRTRMLQEEDMPSVKTVNAGIDFIHRHHAKDSWFLQIECFDPHEPFFVPDKYRELYKCCDAKDAFNFPAYTYVNDKYTKEEVDSLRKEYFALLTMCDVQLGKVLDAFSEYDMWKDTMLIVNTDHGFLLGEHNFIGKNIPPMYDELTHIPFFIHVPGIKCDGQRRNRLAQTIDIAPTLLDCFGLEPLKETDGRSLLKVLKEDKVIHEDILYGSHGGQINYYDGKYCYMKSAVIKDAPVYEMTLMPTVLRGFMDSKNIDKATLVDGGVYSNHHKVLCIPKSQGGPNQQPLVSVIYDKEKDPGQSSPIYDEALMKELDKKLQKAMKKADAPVWQMERMGFKEE